jgi:predicted DNA-binding transcriptional regulator AlpA
MQDVLPSSEAATPQPSHPERGTAQPGAGLPIVQQLLERMTHEQVAAWLGVSPRTLDRWKARGDGPPRIKIGRQLFYRGASLKAWFESREKAS